MELQAKITSKKKEKEQLRELLISEEECVSIEEAIKESERKF